MNKEYQKSEDVREYGERAIKEFNPNNIKESAAKIQYLKVYPYITKTVAARCIRVANEMKFLTDLDYIIEVSGDVGDQLPEDTKNILMYHELLHAYPIYNEKKSEYRYTMRDHDIKDFGTIIDKFGIDWYTKLKTMVSSIYDLTPEETDKISL